MPEALALAVKVVPSSKQQRKQFLLSLKMKHLQLLYSHIVCLQLRHIYKDCLIHKNKRMLLLEERGYSGMHRLDQDVALERGPHLLHIILLGNPHSSTLHDRKTKERDYKNVV